MIESECIRCQGRLISRVALSQIQTWIDEHPDWSRHRVAQQLCWQWNWRTPGGQFKTFAARELLIKLEKRQQLRLPPLRVHKMRRPWGIQVDLPAQCLEVKPALRQPLSELTPLEWRMTRYAPAERAQALGYLQAHHYLGCNRPVGAHLLYLVKDRFGRELAVHLIGAAAWHCAARDQFIGWSAEARAVHLHRIANHGRFLILPWVQVPGLASHLLAQMTRRLNRDWPAVHGYRLELVESFVETSRFSGVAYRAANWRHLGQTSGRTRQEKQHHPKAPPKALWVLPLHREFRQRLATLNEQP